MTRDSYHQAGSLLPREMKRAAGSTAAAPACAIKTIAVRRSASESAALPRTQQEDWPGDSSGINPENDRIAATRPLRWRRAEIIETNVSFKAVAIEFLRGKKGRRTPKRRPAISVRAARRSKSLSFRGLNGDSYLVRVKS